MSLVGLRHGPRAGISRLPMCLEPVHTRGIATTILSSRINAPSTLPPPLTLPAPRKEHEYRLPYFYRVGKSYLQFYKTGVKQVFSNRKTARLISAQYPHLPLISNFRDAVDHGTGQLVSAPEGISSGLLSRAEYQLLRRHAKDIKKVPIFALLLAIFGEWLPLFVIFLDPLIPGTVLLPSQVEKRRKKSAKAAAESSFRLECPTGSLTNLEGAGIHDRPQVVVIARIYSLLGPISQFGGSRKILQRIRAHEQYLQLDDYLLCQEIPEKKDGSVSLSIDDLDEQELDLALEERGLWTAEQARAEKLKLLSNWLNHSRVTNKQDKEKVSPVL